jgi:ribonuclease HII
MSRRGEKLPAGQPTLAAVAASLRSGHFDPSTLEADPRAGARALAARWERRRLRAELEARRLAVMFVREQSAWRAGLSPVAGVDEAGRGPLAGPVVAAAVIFPGVRLIRKLRDSKRLQPDEREALYDDIAASGATIGVGIAEVGEIDHFNILGATRLAWARAVASLRQTPALVLIDGNMRAELSIPQATLVRGDAQCASIAAASIVAKVTRDRLMVELDRRHPQYGFARHKGYATLEHLAALRRFGPSPVHRRAFLPADLRQEHLFIER